MNGRLAFLLPAALALAATATATAQTETGTGATATGGATVTAEATGPGPLVAPATGGWDGGLFLEVTLGMGAPLGDAGYDLLVDTSFVPTLAAGWMFPLGGGEASLGPEAVLTYTPLSTEDLDFAGVNADVYAGRFRVGGGVRFQVDMEYFYLFTHFDVGFDLVHASWDYYVGPAHFEDDESDGGVAFIPGLGFGARVIDWLGITMRLDFPTAMHWDEDDGGVDYDFSSTDLELDFGVTFFL
jgi:hypothetical protein